MFCASPTFLLYIIPLLQQLQETLNFFPCAYLKYWYPRLSKECWEPFSLVGWIPSKYWPVFIGKYINMIGLNFSCKNHQKSIKGYSSDGMLTPYPYWPAHWLQMTEAELGSEKPRIKREDCSGQVLLVVFCCVIFPAASVPVSRTKGHLSLNEMLRLGLAALACALLCGPSCLWKEPFYSLALTVQLNLSTLC